MRKIPNKKGKASKKKKKPNPISLKRKLAIVFSEFIRLRDSDENGMVKCISCDFIGYWKGDIQNTHFIQQKGFPNTVFSELNCNGGCKRCNGFLQGNQYQYYLALKVKYGQETIDNLVIESKKEFKFTREWLVEKLKYYTEQVKILKSQKKLRE